MAPWTKPIFDVIAENFNAREIENFIKEGVIETSPLAYMRGRTFKNAWIIADEMQNATPSQCKMLMTRIGENSRIVITGDVEQADRVKGKNGLMDLCGRLSTRPVPGISVCYMNNQDIQRHAIIDGVLDLYAD
jgi:phosphate starvation-inducible PhoH-like protein